MIEAKANEQVTIEQIGGALTMAGWLWTQAVSERARLSEENATLTQQLADANAEIERLQAKCDQLSELVDVERRLTR